MCIYIKRGVSAVGDLKKKKRDYIYKMDDEEEILIESRDLLTEEQTIERLRTYMKKFYEIQKEKQKGKEGED
jgi:hypothetical protein